MYSKLKKHHYLKPMNFITDKNLEENQFGCYLLRYDSKKKEKKNGKIKEMDA